MGLRSMLRMRPGLSALQSLDFPFPLTWLGLRDLADARRRAVEALQELVRNAAGCQGRVYNRYVEIR